MRAGIAALAIVLLPAPAVQAAPPSTVSAYLRLFDRNGDGQVSLDEYRARMMRGFRAMDRNHDGIIERDEQPAGPRQRDAVTRSQYRDNLAASFRRQDRNGDGFLDAGEMAAPPR